MVDPDFVLGNEQSGWRPALVVSDDGLNHSEARLSMVVPATSRLRGLASHIRVSAGEGGLDSQSELLCEQLRSLSHHRFRRWLGRVEPTTLSAVELVLARLLDLH